MTVVHVSVGIVHHGDRRDIFTLTGVQNSLRNMFPRMCENKKTKSTGQRMLLELL